MRETKNDEPRTLPLAGKALEALRALRLPIGSQHTCFLSLLACPTVRALRRALVRRTQNSGIEDFHFHDLRHTTASMLAAQGASLLEIADVLGHKTFAIVKRYSHLVVDHKARVIENDRCEGIVMERALIVFRA